MIEQPSDWAGSGRAVGGGGEGEVDRRPSRSPPWTVVKVKVKVKDLGRLGAVAGPPAASAERSRISRRRWAQGRPWTLGPCCDFAGGLHQLLRLPIGPSEISPTAQHCQATLSPSQLLSSPLEIGGR
jgi:hypothetical protein